MILPADHPQRIELNDEVHARPPEAMTPPLRVSYIALYSDLSLRDQQWERLSDLARRFSIAGPQRTAAQFSADFGPFRLKWERHTEFVRYMFIVAGLSEAEDPFTTPAINAVPADWLATLPGLTIVATHGVLARSSGQPIDFDHVSAVSFAGNVLIGSTIAGGLATALTDFRVQPDGLSRFLVEDRGMAPRQTGRMIQRLLEIDTYRIMALLALPVARDLVPVLSRCEQELAEITTALTTAREEDEAVLLARLTRLEAEIESRVADNHYRFSAAAAYYDLVQQRIGELREDRIQGLQTFKEFNERRLAPAMSTCRAVARRQDELSQRVARATQLLSTRVDLTRERQNQAVLESMDRRAKLQLRLQETVEGLSVAAVTYYIVGLVGYLAKGLRAGGLALDSDIVMAVSIPVVALVGAFGVRKVRRMVQRGTP